MQEVLKTLLSTKIPQGATYNTFPGVNELNEAIRLLTATPFVEKLFELFRQNPRLDELTMFYEVRSEYDDQTYYDSHVIYRVDAEDTDGNELRYLRLGDTLVDTDSSESFEEYRIEDCEDLSEDQLEMAKGCEWVLGIETNDSPFSTCEIDEDDILAVFNYRHEITLTRSDLESFLEGDYTLQALTNFFGGLNAKQPEKVTLSYLRQHGSSVPAINDLETQLGTIYRVFAFPEMDEDPFEIKSVENLHNYTNDQLMTIPIEQ